MVSRARRRLGYSERHLNRLLTDELGAGPLAVARAQRAHTARLLDRDDAMPLTDVAFAAGFGSVRQFNETIREVFATSPTDLRAAARRTCRSRELVADSVRNEFTRCCGRWRNGASFGVGRGAPAGSTAVRRR